MYRLFEAHLASSWWLNGENDSLVTVKKGYDLDLGIAKGFATIGAISFQERWDYGIAPGAFDPGPPTLPRGCAWAM